MAKRRIKREAVKQTPRERLVKDNVRVIAPSGRTTWKIQVVTKESYVPEDKR